MMATDYPDRVNLAQGIQKIVVPVEWNRGFSVSSASENDKQKSDSNYLTSVLVGSHFKTLFCSMLTCPNKVLLKGFGRAGRSFYLGPGTTCRQVAILPHIRQALDDCITLHCINEYDCS